MMGIFSITLLLLLSGFCPFSNGSESPNNSGDVTASVGVKETPQIISLVLLGRKGSGITSTVRQILGPKTTIKAVEIAVASTDILEYTLRIPSSSGDNSSNYLKIIDVPGLELEDSLEHDAEIFSNLKSYLHDRGLPTFFLVVFRFDDKHISEENSHFRQLLKSLEVLQTALFQATTDNTLFLLTRLLSEPLEIQQAPDSKIQEFRQIIQEVTTLPSSVPIIVGDNKPDNNTVQIENGYIKLPNNELYPKNILDKLVEVARSSISVSEEDKEVVQDVTKSLIDSRESASYHTQEVVAHPTDEEIFENDLEAFEYLLRQDNLQLPNNEVQGVLQSVYENQDDNIQFSSHAQLLALRICLRNLHLLETMDQVPQTLADQVKFFQLETSGMTTTKYAMKYLKNALAIEAPEFPSQDLVVGFGYDIVHDRVLRTTPFLRNTSKRPRPSRTVGYQFPDFVECEKLNGIEESVLANVTNTQEESHRERLGLLTTPDKDSILVPQLKGSAKSYFNLKAKESKKISAVKEYRVLECKMDIGNDTTITIDESFPIAVLSLPRFNASCNNSIQKWNLFLHTHGTHIITKSYGGGYFQGLVDVNTDEHLSADENIQNTLNDIVHFKNLESGEGNGCTQYYQFNAGQGTKCTDVRASRIHQMTQTEQNQLIEEFKSVLNVKFEMLTNEIELVPLSQLIKHEVSEELGKDAEAATSLLYRGELVSTDTNTPVPAVSSTNVIQLREKARNQAQSMKAATLDKTRHQIEQFNQFLNTIESE